MVMNNAVEFIPQRPPMVMIDEHISSKENETISALVIRSDNLFCEGGVLTEPGLIENIAQTAALSSGYLFSQGKKSSLGGKPPLGYIGGIKNLKIHFLPEVGKRIQTKIKIEAEIMDVSVAKGEITCDGKPVADCEMKIFMEKEKTE
jgi:3-hydroxymyristoyl/3-hydroxydecanoyl-(acyl carrier protein) dehydratase